MLTTATHSVNSSTNVEKASIERLEKDIESIISGSLPYFTSIFKKMIGANPKNAEILYNFLVAEQNEKNVKLSTKTTHIKIIYSFNKFLDFKDFDKITKQDIQSYLNSLRKSETEDPTHKWIGTYNVRQMVLSKFLRWLYNNEEYDKEKWITPSCLQGIKPLKRKEKSPYKPSDIWTNEEHSLFLRYCPEKRDRCYHAMASDTSCRPHELLSLKIEDVKFKMSSNGTQYAEVHISQSKTKPRTIPLIFSVPYIKEWLESHPLAGNPTSWLFISLGDSSFGKQLTENALYKQYSRTYKQKYFPNLLNDNIEERDKAYIRNLLTKPWAPYIQRHSSLTQKSKILKESLLRDHAGWSMTSRMPNIYIHYFGNESSKSLLEIYGIEDFSNEQTQLLKAKQCPNCNEPNRPDSRFCIKCRMVLSYDAYSETMEDQKRKENEIEQLRREQESSMKALREEMNQQFSKIMELVQQNPTLTFVKPDALTNSLDRMNNHVSFSETLSHTDN